jgi:hypothetical protein
MRLLATSVLALVLTAAAACADDIVLRGMGSFHIAGRIAEIHGKPVQDIVRVPRGPSSRLDPNGLYQVEQIRGNSHMVMMDRNNDAVANVIQKWLAERGLTIE